MSLMRTIVPALIAVLSLAAAAPADAARRLITKHEVVGAPAIAGDDVLYAAVARSRIEITRAAPDGTKRVLATVPRPALYDPLLDPLETDSEVSTVEVHGTAARVAYRAWNGSAARTSPYEGQGSVWAGPLAGPLRRLATVDDDAIAERAFDVDGDRIAYGRGTDTGYSVVVRDLGTGQVLLTLPAGRIVARLAGRYLAYVDRDNEIVVYDLDARQPVNSVANGYCEFDVQSDGKLVAGGCGDAGVAWYSPADPKPHAVASGDDMTGRTVAIDSDTIAYARKGAGLGVSDLAGNFRALAADSSAYGDIDLRGGHLAYATRGCAYDSGAVWLDDLAGPITGTTMAPCRFVLGRRTSYRASPQGVIEVAVSCPTGCRGGVGVAERPDADDADDSQPFELGAGEHARIDIELNLTTALRHTRTRKLYLLAEVEQREAQPLRISKRVTISNLPR